MLLILLHDPGLTHRAPIMGAILDAHLNATNPHVAVNATNEGNASNRRRTLENECMSASQQIQPD